MYLLGLQYYYSLFLALNFIFASMGMALSFYNIVINKGLKIEEDIEGYYKDYFKKYLFLIIPSFVFEMLSAFLLCHSAPKSVSQMVILACLLLLITLIILAILIGPELQKLFDKDEKEAFNPNEVFKYQKYGLIFQILRIILLGWILQHSICL